MPVRPTHLHTQNQHPQRLTVLEHVVVQPHMRELSLADIGIPLRRSTAATSSGSTNKPGGAVHRSSHLLVEIRDPLLSPRQDTRELNHPPKVVENTDSQYE